jgi:primosomal protein N' (replication factor Y)
MPEYVELAVHVPKVSGVFHYHVPIELQGRLRPGHLVLASFGRQVVQGVVLRHVTKPQVSETKPIDSLLDDEPVLTTAQLVLAEWMADATLAPLAACVGLMLPPGVGQLADVEYALTDVTAPDGLSAGQTALLNKLRQRGAMSGRQLDRALPRRNWRESVRALQGKGLISTRPIIPLPRAKPKTITNAELLRAVPAEDSQLGKTAATRKRRFKLLQRMQEEGKPIDANWLAAEGGKPADLHALAELGFVSLGRGEKVRDPLAELAYDPAVPPQLTADQSRAWAAVNSSLESKDASKPILLHGVTGSGKTEIYLRAVARTLELGHSAIVLVPEIALTPQTAQRFAARFAGQVGLLHSELSEGERYDTWRRARSGELRVILGARSALFAPIQNLGLIVIDEEHDESYYESGQDPHYHARETAVAYAQSVKGLCLLGSATPDVGSYTHALQGAWQLQALPARILAHRASAEAHRAKIGASARYVDAGPGVDALDLPPVNVVDMRSELKAGNRSIFSRALQSGLTEILQHGQQAILFLNRRGSATYVFCRDCGESLSCPNCDTPLTQHFERGAATDVLLCHHCGYRRKMPARCPNCSSVQIRHYGTGTEAVEAELRKLFPDARPLRWDRDSTRGKGAHARILDLFSRHQADVLIGTQMLAKGLDLPLVTLVGMVLADVGLNLPDYRAGERVFQVLTQVAGRAGRSPLGGQVVLQTFNPDHYAIQAAADHNYAEFYKEESAQRRTLRYPPFAQLVRLEYRDLDARKAESEARKLAASVKRLITQQRRGSTDLIGPAPCFLPRLNRQYRWQIILRGPDPTSVLRGLKLPDWRVEVNPPSLL